jgi:ABC-type branched-subunit amino acid transport system ATPase component
MPRPIKVGIRVFTCLILGSQGAGKTVLLQTFSGCKVRKSKQSQQQAQGANNAKQEGGAEEEAHSATYFVPATDQAPPTARSSCHMA